MKKTLAIILAIIMIVSVSLVFTGCNSNSVKQFFSGKEPSSIEDSDEGGEKKFALDGGWTKAESPEITEDFLKVFSKATETLAGAELTPVAYIASQVVAGVNHLVLCSQTATVPDAEPTYVLVYVYADPDGNAEITSIVDSDIPAITENDLVGSWYPAENPEVTKEIKEVLEKASEALTGADYKPVALLGTQVVAGTNYALLCEMTATVPDAQSEYAVVYIYEDLEGNAEITDSKTFNAETESNSEEITEVTSAEN